MEFYIDVEKTSPNWTYHLRLRVHPDEKIGIQIATFNPYTRAQNPGLVEKIVSILNKHIGDK